MPIKEVNVQHCCAMSWQKTLYGWVENVSHSPARPSLVTWGLLGCMSISAQRSLCLVQSDQVCPRQHVKLREVSQLAEKEIF